MEQDFNVQEIEKTMTKKGSAVAWDADGRTITAAYLPGRKAWVVCFYAIDAVADNSRTRCFPDKRIAAMFIARVADPTKTRQLCWWDNRRLFCAGGVR